MVAASQDVKIECKPKIYSFNFVESPYNDSDVSRSGDVNNTLHDGSPAKNHRKGSAILSSVESADDEKRIPGIDILSVHGESTTFIKFVPNRNRASLLFDLYLQDSSGNRFDISLSLESIH